MKNKYINEVSHMDSLELRSLLKSNRLFRPYRKSINRQIVYRLIEECIPIIGAIATASILYDIMKRWDDEEKNP